MLETKIGKIQNIEFGFGGYQDAMIGFRIELGSDKNSWSTGTFWGYWSMERSSSAKWSEEDRVKSLGHEVLKVADLLTKAKVETLNQLIGKPVEVIFEKNVLKTWRILEEVI